MKKLQLLSSALLIAAISTPAAAEDVKFSLGGGFYNSTQKFDKFSDDEFNGLALTATAAFNNYVGARLNAYSAEHDRFSTWEASGQDLQVLLGSNLVELGFKAYVSAGFFREEWEEYGFKHTFNGAQFGFGMGYNWKEYSIDFAMNYRDSADYDDFWVPDTSSVTSHMLSASYRF